MKARLVFNDKTLTSEDLYGGISYEKNINGETDLVVGTCAAASVSFTTDVALTSGESFMLYLTFLNESTETKIGQFFISNVSRQKTKYKIQAYDLMGFLGDDNYIIPTANMEALRTQPHTLQGIFLSICQRFNLPNYPNFPNQFEMAQWSVDGENITARAVFSAVAEVAGCFCHVNANGQITISNYATANKTLTNANYRSVEWGEEPTAAIDRIWYGPTDDDEGLIYGDGDNTLNLVASPLISLDTALDQMEVISDTVAPVSEYYPCKLTLGRDNGINCGDIITVDGRTVNVMSKSISNSGVVLVATGNAHRSNSRNGQRREIQGIEHKYNKLTRVLDATISEVGNLEGQVSTVTQTATGLESIVSAKARYIRSYVEPTDAELGDIWEKSNATPLKYYLCSGTGDDKWREITKDEADNYRVVNRLSQTLDGVVFEGESGETVIDGSHITTGTIEADRLNLTGAITFSDFSSATREGVENPDYIKQTYIDSTTIKSPTIEATRIIVEPPEQQETWDDNYPCYVMKAISPSTGEEVVCGYIGGAFGSTGTEQTNGVMLSSVPPSELRQDSEPYILVTNAGVQLRAGQARMTLTNGGINFYSPRAGEGTLMPTMGANTVAVFG